MVGIAGLYSESSAYPAANITTTWVAFQTIQSMANVIICICMYSYVVV